MQNIVTTTTDTNNKVAGRMVEKLHDHADAFGVGIDGQMEQALQNFFESIIQEERTESAHDSTYEGLTVDVIDRMAEAMKRLAQSVESGNF